MYVCIAGQFGVDQYRLSIVAFRVSIFEFINFTVTHADKFHIILVSFEVSIYVHIQSWIDRLT